MVDAMGEPVNHRRTGSGRSSVCSGVRVSTGLARLSTASSTPTSSHSRSPNEALAQETPVASLHSLPTNTLNDLTVCKEVAVVAVVRTVSVRNSFGGLADIPESEKFERVGDRIIRDSAGDLRRRESADDRTTTMSGCVRLFVANPDLSD